MTLTPTAAAGSTFAGWSGACTGTGTCQVTMDQARAVTATFNITVGGPGTVDPDGLFCGAQHRGKCKGLKVKGVFPQPGNASWTFDAYNPTPGNSGKAGTAAKKKIRLGQIKKVIKKAGTVSVAFKLKGKKANKLYRQVKKNKLKAILVTLTFTGANGAKSTTTKTVKLKG